MVSAAAPWKRALIKGDLVAAARRQPRKVNRLLPLHAEAVLRPGRASGTGTTLCVFMWVLMKT